ncbi:hypothetical protein AgCh_019551 [Apium graveolens]
MRVAIFYMHPDKAPGPDGMTPAFFQKNWAVVGREVVTMTKEFFRTGELTENLNATNIVLIPKKKNPALVSELRPIALCNVAMNIITKVIANRLKNVLVSVIPATQSAFLHGRLVSDNVMISFEVMHYLKRKKFGKDGFMALKLDMSKAYDIIEWKFLKKVLLKKGFSNWWTHLVLQCVQSVEYNIVHGEYIIGPIKPICGLRQGNPLSPYLFIICAEGLTTLIKLYEERKWLQGIKICRKALVISHMLFADDSYLYCKAETEEASKVIQLLNTYEQASGQKINRDKSTVFFCANVMEYNKERVCNELQIREADNSAKYPGLPNILGRNKSVVFGYLKDGVKTIIQNWSVKNVSKPAKEILIKMVAQSLPTFAMNVFLLPLDFTRDIETSMSKFFWNSSQKDNSQISWMGWDRMSRHKHAGGTGNEVMIMNQHGLSDSENPYITTVSPSLVNQKVVSLFYTDTKEWDLEVSDIFDDRDKQCIVNTVVEKELDTDVLSWRQVPTGQYSVRSAYKILQE